MGCVLLWAVQRGVRTGNTFQTDKAERVTLSEKELGF